MTTRILASYGWMPWTEATELIGAVQAVWLGPAGIVEHDGAAWPASLPLTTRIHAWGPAPKGPLWRLIPRTSDGTVLVTALATAETDLPGTTASWREAEATEHTTADGRTRTFVAEESSIQFLSGGADR